MSQQTSNQPSTQISYTGLGMALGLLVGGLIGLIADNIVIFAGGGMVLGLSIGAALENRQRDQNE